MLPAITALFYGTCAILSVLFFADAFGIITIPIGSMVGIGLQTFVILAVLRSKGKRLGFSLGVQPGVKQVAKLSSPRLLGYGLGHINLIIDRMFASSLGIGYVSSLTYAHRLFQIPSAILISAFVRTIMPVLSEHAATGNKLKVGQLVGKSIRLIAFVTVPVTIFLFIIRTPLVCFLFQRGAFDAQATATTASVFFFYNMGMVAFCLNIVLLGVFFALQDAAVPTKIALANAALNIIFDIILIEWIGIGGIALASSLIAFFNLIFLLVFLHKRIGSLGGAETIVSLTKILAASLIMGYVLGILPENLGAFLNVDSSAFQIFALFIISTAIYSMICSLLRVRELKGMVSMFRKRLLS
jgi:putative peptidoglycan lipid II flippase